MQIGGGFAKLLFDFLEFFFDLLDALLQTVDLVLGLSKITTTKISQQQRENLASSETHIGSLLGSGFQTAVNNF
jgi:hypothetical protein